MFSTFLPRLVSAFTVIAAMIGAAPSYGINPKTASQNPSTDSSSRQPEDRQQEDHQPKKGQQVSVILEGKPLQDHNLAAISRLIVSGEVESVTVFVSPTYFLNGDQASVAKLTDFLLEHKGQIKVGVHLSAQRTLVENSGVSFRTGPTFWGYPLDVTDCHELCGIEVPLLGYTPKEQNAIIKTAVKTLKMNVGQAIRHSIIEGGFFTKSLAGRLRHNGIAVDHTLAGKTAADYYDIRHFPLYGWLEKSGTLSRINHRASRCVINLVHPEAVGGCYDEQSPRGKLVTHIYHSEAFLLTSGGPLLLSH